MKIFHIISGLKVGGAESALYNFLAHLPQNGDEHYVAYFHQGYNARAIQQLDIKVFHIRGIISCYDPCGYYRLKRIIRSIAPDLLHTSLWSANIVGRIIARQLNIPIICDIHGNPSYDGAFRNWLDKKTAAIPTKIVAVSDGVKEAYLKTIVGAVHDETQKQLITQRLIVIKNGVNSSLLRQKATLNKLDRSKLGLAPTDFVIGSVGRLEPIKSYNILLKAVALLIHKSLPGGPIKLCLVGNGTARRDLELLAQQFDISSHVIFTGMRNDSYRFYPLFDCFALSSQSEGLSIALLEAMAFGLPIVTTHHSNHHEVVVEGVNGYLVTNQNAQGLALALEKLYLQPHVAKQMRIDNIKKANETFSLQAAINRYHLLYREVVKN